MKTIHLSEFFLPVVIICLVHCITYGQNWTSIQVVDNAVRAKKVIQDNEIERNQVGQKETIYCNPLFLNGHVLNYGNFTLQSTGELTLMKGDPKSKGATNIPFTAKLRRNGILVSMEGKDFVNTEFYNIEISKLLVYAQPGDQLIILPVNEEDWKAKRVLNLVL